MFEEDESTVMIPTFSAGSFFADRYRIVGLLGSGAMGRVYSAVEIHGNRKVALKVLHAERVAETETVERFKREAEVLASLGHPCIVEVYAFHHTSDNVPYLAMELLEGLTLKTRLQNGGRFEDPANLQEIIDGLGSALEAAHRVGVIHRDLKPDNIFLPATGSPRVKIVDFGLSRVAKQDKHLTQSGMIIGTPRYMAPEQIKDARTIGLTSDLYSLGVVVYECLTGKSPYPAEDYGQLLGCLLEGRSIPFVAARPDLPRFDSFMARALARDPAERFQSGSDFADGYAMALGKPSTRSQYDDAKPKPAKPRRRSKSHAGMVRSKSSTLAWDASAAREALKHLEAGPPPGMVVDPEALEAQAELKAKLGGAPPPSTPPPAPATSPAVTSPKAASPWPETMAGLFSDDATKPLPPPHMPNTVVGPPSVSGTAATGMQEAVTAEQIAAAGGVPVISPGALTPAPLTPMPLTPAPVTPAPLSAQQHAQLRSPPASYAPPPISAPPISAPPHSAPPHSAPAPSQPPPSMHPASQAPPPQVQAQGGDTLYLGDASQIPGYPPPPLDGSPATSNPAYAPPQHAAPQNAPPQHAPPQNAAPQNAPPQNRGPQNAPRKKRSYGLLIFIVALLLVVVFSALGGFALRAHMRGELNIPGLSE